MAAGRRAAGTGCFDAVCRTRREGNTIPLKAPQDTGRLQGVATGSWLRVARPLWGAQ